MQDEPDHPLRRNDKVLRAELEESLEEVRRGKTVPFEDVMQIFDEFEARARKRAKPRLSAAE